MSALPGAVTRELTVRSVPSCPVCGGAGGIRHEGLRDKLFGAPGTWRMRRCSAEACGLLWLDPAPVEDDIGLAYRGYYTHSDGVLSPARTLGGPWGWAKQGYIARRFGYRVEADALKRVLGLMLSPFPTRRENLDRLVMHLPAGRRGRMLDVGCGEGLTLETLRTLGWRVEGIDTDPEVVARGRRRGFDVRLGGLGDQRYPDGSFDAVTGCHVLEHVHDPGAMLRECHRVLRPGGVLVVLTPNADGLGHRRFGRAWRGLEPPRHLQVFTAAALARLAAGAGFEGPRVSSTARMAAFIHRQSRSLSAARRASASDVLDRALFQAAERWRLRSEPWAGEELLLIAERR